MNILEELYYGNVSSENEDYKLIQHPEHKKYNAEINEYMEYFRAQLSAEDYKRLNKLYDTIGARNNMVCCHYFAYGFKLAFLMSCEIFRDESSH